MHIVFLPFCLIKFNKLDISISLQGEFPPEISEYFHETKSFDSLDQFNVGKFLFRSTLFAFVFQIVHQLK